jgi:hypothetical protein
VGPAPGGSQPGPRPAPRAVTPAASQSSQGAQGPQEAKARLTQLRDGPKLTCMQAPVQPPPTPRGNAAPATQFTPGAHRADRHHYDLLTQAQADVTARA